MKSTPWPCMYVMALSLVSAGASAEIYKWTDANGVTHFGDRPLASTSAGAKPEVVRTAPSPRAEPLVLPQPHEPAIIPPQNRLRLGGSPTPAGRDDVMADEQRARLRAAQNATTCFQARRQRDVLSEKRPVYRDDRGNYRLELHVDTYLGPRHYLDEGERQAAVEAVKARIGQHCARPNDPGQQLLARQAQVRTEWCMVAAEHHRLAIRPGARTSRGELDKHEMCEAFFCENPDSPFPPKHLDHIDPGEMQRRC